MSKFARTIQSPEIKMVDEHHWFRELLKLYRPAGVQSDRDAQGRISSLRVAVRDGYLSFYGAGQQIAKVKCTARSFYEEVHWEYVGVKPEGTKDYLKLDAPTADAAEATLANRVAKASSCMGERSYLSMKS